MLLIVLRKNKLFWLQMFSSFPRCSRWQPGGVVVPTWQWPNFAETDEPPGLVPAYSWFQRFSGPVEPWWAQRPRPSALAPFKAKPTQKRRGEGGFGAHPGHLVKSRRMGGTELGEKHFQGKEQWCEGTRLSCFFRRLHSVSELRASRLFAGPCWGAVYVGSIWIAPTQNSWWAQATPWTFPRPSLVQPPMPKLGLSDWTGWGLASRQCISQTEKGRGP